MSYGPLILSAAEKLAQKLQQHGFRAQVLPESLREYHVHIQVPTGKCALYYKPSKDRFLIVTQNVQDEQLRETIEAIWHGTDPSMLQAFVDGSYGQGKIAWACLVLRGNETLYENAGCILDRYGQRQIAGEIEAVLQVLVWCQAQRHSAVQINYDYEGLRAWATREWQAKTPLSQAYQAYLQKQTVQLRWRKIPAHQGHSRNQHVDSLAKQALSQTERMPIL